jgi:hypothetical protein
MSSEPADIFAASERYRRELEAGDDAAVARILRAYRAAWDRIQADLKALEVERRKPRSATYRRAVQERLQALRSQIGEQLRQLAGRAASETRKLQDAGVRKAGDHAEQLTLFSVPESDRPTVKANWNRLPVGAFRAQVGFLGDGSPLLETMERVASGAAARAGELLSTAVALGWNPRKTARELGREVDAAPSRLCLIARTESIRSYREASHQQYRANSVERGGVLTGWLWSASLSPRSCAACLAMHGTEHPVSERLQDHPNGRCAMIPLTRSNRERMVAATAGKADEFAAGLSDLKLAQVLGSGAAAQAFRAGQVKLADFAGVRDSPKWGRSIHRKSLRAALRDRIRGVADGLTDPGGGGGGADLADEEIVRRVTADLTRLRDALHDLTPLRSRWNGIVRVDPTIGTRANALFLEDGTIVVIPRLIYRKTRWRTLIHELIHSLGVPVSKADYEKEKGWEEGFVEVVQRRLRPAVMARLGDAYDEAFIAALEPTWAFQSYVDAAEAILAATGEDPLAVCYDVLQQPVAARPAYLIRRFRTQAMVISKQSAALRFTILGGNMSQEMIDLWEEEESQ